MIGITMGDANGVGPEIILNAFRQNMLRQPFVVYGDMEILHLCNRVLGFDVPLCVLKAGENAPENAVAVRDLKLLESKDCVPGTLSATTGAAALEYVLAATRDALAGTIDAMVTLPINKEAVRLQVPDFSGHTDVIASACNAKRYTMTLISDRLVVPHVTAHVSLRNAIESLRTDRILEVLRLTAQILNKLGREGVIAVLGVNPHAGEAGAFGTEEIDVIIPAIERAYAEGINVKGPVSPDTAFMRALRGDFVAVVCMYHDQGHIAMKTIGFDEGVNVTVGLPIVRTSVDHGTAFDIAWKGIASTGSFKKAFDLAVQLAPGTLKAGKRTASHDGEVLSNL
jgi:4-phospho-D-threonate 3-dehydrogenase / 4-phospho-D-erythronate 3-dehydrogenase